MTFAWQEYLALAQHLQDQSTNSTSGISQEAALRCAVSRAYYAAFCHARNYARDHHGFKLSHGPDDHTRIREHFQRLGHVKIAQDLEQLRRWRNQCDYNDNVSNISLMCFGAMMAAQNVFASFP
jgi:hypothetical protein